MNTRTTVMDTKTTVMDTKTKIFKIAVQIFLLLSYIGYFVSLYRGIDNNISTYTNYIIVIVCLSESLFKKPGKENKILYALTILNGIIFTVWVVAMILTLFL